MTKWSELRARLILQVRTDEKLRELANDQASPTEEEAANIVDWYVGEGLKPDRMGLWRYLCRHPVEKVGDTTTLSGTLISIFTDEILQMRREALALGQFAECVLKLPGVGVAVDDMPDNDDDYFPVMNFEGGWKATTLLNREVCMLETIEELTNKPDWWTKCRDTHVAQRWKEEMLAVNWPSVTGYSFADLSPEAADAIIQELRTKATLYEETGLIPVMDYSAAAIKSDSILTDDLIEALKAAISPLENVPDQQKDWHPRSNNQVLDLVHPSLWPLVYGRSRIVPEKRINIDDAVKYCGTGVVLPVPLREISRREPISARFQWIPSDVTISPEGTAKIDSYINNLHPEHHAGLYPIIERFIEKSLPAWDVIYRWPEEFYTQRIKTLDCLRSDCTVPDICGNTGPQGCDRENRPLDPDETPRGSEEDDDDDEYDDDRDERDEEWFNQTHLPRIPDPKPDFLKLKSSDVRSSGFFNSASRIQVIVKLANIHLTPDSPTYEGGTWHVEGMLNEHICATALYYYDSENVTDSHLRFRTRADREGLAEGALRYEQSDNDAIRRVFAMEGYDSSVQTIGRVLTRQGRALFFPNVYQHRVSSFKLQDPTKPGHRKILALFLVDPKIPVISTANVPPQQKHWWTEAANLSSSMTPSGGPMMTSKLPLELREMVAGHVDYMTDWDEAKKIREELMKERSAGTDGLNNELQRAEYHFCEH